MRPHPRALQWCRPREGLGGCGARAAVSAAGRTRARVQGGHSREKLRGRQRQRRRGRLPRVCSAPHAAAGAAFPLLSLPSAPECGGTASFCAARLPPDLSARVSGGHGRLLGCAGECSLFLFGRPPLRTGCCLFLETLFSAILGVPGAGLTPGPLTPHLPPPNPVSLARPIRACPRPSGVPWPLPPRGPGLGQELAGWAGVRSEVRVFVLAPRPAQPGEGRREGSGGRAGKAWAGPSRALAPARASSGSPSRAGSAGSPRRAELALPRSPRA